jgi:hypothetical protein
MKKKYEDLVRMLLIQLDQAQIPYTKILSDSNFVKAIKVGRHIFMTKYANENVNGRFWFGFMPDDVERSNSYSKVILVIGSDSIERLYAVPYGDMTKFLKKGEPVWDSHCFKYIATIFAKDNYLMKVEKGDRSILDVENYRERDIIAFFQSCLS